MARRWLVLAATLLATAGVGVGVLDVEINTANEYFFVPGDPALVSYEDFKETFGSDEFVVVLFHTGDTFTPEALQALESFATQAEEKVPYVVRVSSIVTAEYIRSEDDAIIVDPFIGSGEIPTSTAALAALKARALTSPFYRGRLLTDDGSHAAVLLETEVKEGDGEYRKEICDAARALADSPEFAKYAPRLVGAPILDADVDRTLASESRFFGGISILVVILVLIATFRRFTEVTAPILVIVVSVVWVIGLMGWLSVPLTMMSIVLPGVVMVVGCSDAIHVVAEYRMQLELQTERAVAIAETVRVTGLPCLFTSLTTMVGFGSLTVMDLRAGKEMGLFAAIGVGIAFVMTFLLLPPLLSFGSSESRASDGRRAGARAHEATLYHRFLARVAAFTARRSGSIIVVSALVFVVGVVGLTQVVVSADILRTFDESTRLRRDYDAVERILGGTWSLEIVASAEEEGGIFEPAFLQEVAQLRAWLEDQQRVRSSLSLLDVMEDLNRVANGSEERHRRIPETRAMAAQLFLLYESGGAEQIDSMVTPERDRIRINVRTDTGGSRELQQLLERLEVFRQEHLHHTKIEPTGVGPLFARMLHYLTRSQVSSFSLAFIAVALMMIVLFRSVSQGLLSMVPNILPLSVTFGYMGFTGIPLNVGTVMIASVAIGIAVDDSIHYVSHYRHHRNQGLDVTAAIEATTTGVGNALLSTSVVLTVGFSVFGLSDLSHLTNFGLLTALTVVTALAADFLVLPALLLRLDAWRSGSRAH